MTTVNKKLKKTASGAITWSVIVTQILSPVSLSLIPANSFASSGNKDVTQIYASDEHANKVASFAASAGQSLANNNASSFAVNTLSTQATKEVVDWLQQYGNARIKLNVDDSFSLKDSSFDFLYPWLDTQDYVLFSQTSLHRTDDRNQTNIGLGIRHFTPDNAMLGANVFYDYDLSRSHSRAGFGVEYWRDYFRLGVNTYFGLSDWKNSRDIDDYLERPANGWDFSAEGWLPAYPQLGASIQFEKYYGKNVGLFGSDNLQENPYAVTGGISYTPVPLIKFSAQHKQGQSNTHDTTFGVEFNYRPGVSLAEQLSSDNVAVMREVQNRRYDFVERNNNIVLEYKKKHALKISLPESVQGEGESIIPVTLTINNASGGIKSVQWNDSAFTAAGGKISGNGTSWQITLPAYKSEGVNSWNVGATVQDNRGNVSNYAVMNISVTDSGVSTADSSFTLDGDSSPTISADSQSTYPIVLSLKDSNGKALTGLADDIEMSVEFTADSNSARQRETVTAPSLGAVEEISAGVYRSVLAAGSQAGTVRVTAKVQGKTFTLNIKQAAITDSDVSTADSSFTLDGDSSPTISADSQSTYPIVLSLKDSNGKALTGLADDIEMSVEFTADSNSARQRETVTAPSLGAVEEISAGVYRSVLAAGSQAGTVRVTAKVQGKTFTLNIKQAAITDSDVSTADSSFTLDGDSSPTISADSQSTYPIVLSLKDSNGKALTGLADDIEMSVEFTADSNSARQRETVTAPSLGAVEEISAGVYRSVLAAGSQAGTVRVTAKVQGKTFTLNIKQAAITDSDVSTADSSFTLDGDSSPTISADSQSTYPIVLSLKDSNGKALTGLADDIEMSVEFTADSNSARQRETVTAPSLGAVEEISAGVYRSVLAAGSQAGTVRVTAKVQGKTFTLSIKQTAATEPDSEVSAVLTAAPAEQVVGYNINLQLAVKDSQGNAITGDNTLSFYALNQAEGVEFGTVTEKDGVYSATVTSKRAGKITIGVKSDSHDFSGVKKEITFIEDRQQVTFSQFEASQNNALADGKQRNMVTVSLADRFGNVVPGYAVTLSLPAGITQVGGEHAVSTDENGNAIFALISSTPGSYVITAHAGSQMSTELTVTFASNMTGASLSLTPESSSLISNIPANGKDAAVLDVQLTNTNASVNGQKIQLITSSEGLSVPTNIVTDSTGHVSVPLTTVKAGEYTVTARVTDGSHSVESGSVKLTFVPDVASAELNMSVSKQEIVADGSENATVNIQLVDANNNAFTGEVDLTITPSTGASLTSSNLQLDAHGQATTQFTASKSGQYTIQAEYVLDGKRITASQNIDAVTDVKGAVLEITSSASSAVVSDTNNLVFTLLLKSKSGEALSGRALNVKTSGPSKYGALVVDKTTVTTDENGQATVSVHGRTVGSYKLTATLNELGSDVSAVKSFSLYADDANGVLTLTKDPGYETNDGSPVGIYARFVDHFGNPLSGTVEFSAGSEDSPDSQRVKMEPATVTLHWTGNAASEFSTYESGYHWIKAKITNSKNTYEKTIRTYVVKLPEKDS
ncbi:inverse autotransporter beta domain-containing protein [Escherichia coli]|nr:inverse autotransporter beta domain-containing protein [Escherichia coli]MCD6688765.1 inverse autotransporter beta domain-containing protein [Escherichia coli]